jgi:thiol-disulfide isomerase/thioredoxin
MIRFKINLKTIAAAIAVTTFGVMALPVLAEDTGARAMIIAAAHPTAPEFAGIGHWLNSEPLTMAKLRGKVVLVDFWTYGCYNCVNTLPYVKALQQKYGKDAFTVIGVHTPEFPYEKSTANVEAAIRKHGITYPVAQDNNFTTWKAYGNQYWPAQYIVDKSGKIVYAHAGEGQYDAIEKTIQELLKGTS